MLRSLHNGSAADEALHGNVRDFPLPMLLRTLESRARTGALRLGNGGEIWVSQGRIYLATTPGSPSLSSVLAGAGLGTAGEIDRMFADSRDLRPVLDQLLPSNPDRQQVAQRLLHEYVLAALFEMLLPSDVSFTFDDGRAHRLGDRLASDSSELVEQAEHRLTIWTRIATRIPSTAAIFRLAPVLPDGAWERLVSADEWRLLALLDGHRTVADVVAADGGSAFGVCSSLYRLLLEGVVEPVLVNAPDLDPASDTHIGRIENQRGGYSGRSVGLTGEGNRVEPIRSASTEAAQARPSAMAQTMRL
jgi:hypothetical protein